MSQNKNLVLTAMVFAVAMTFIDQTIVAIAIPSIQRHLSLSGTGAQWVINGYLLALSALFAFGGKLADVLGRRRVLVWGVIGFAVTSALCGLTPTGDAAQAWLIVFRILQGATAALLFPAAVGIVVASFPVNERGKAMALFFGISGGLTAIGPIAGGFLTQWTWRAIFWINIPVAIIALILIWRSQARQRTPSREHRLPRHHLDHRRDGAADPRAAAVSPVGLGEHRDMGLPRQRRSCPGRLRPLGDDTAPSRCSTSEFSGAASSPSTTSCSRRCRSCSCRSSSSRVSTPRSRSRESSSNAGVYILWFFVGFVIMAQIGGRMLDRRGARAPIVIGCALGAVGF